MRNPCGRETTAKVWSGWRGRPTARLTRVTQPGKHAYTRPNTHTYTNKPTKKQMKGIWKWVGEPSHNNVYKHRILVKTRCGVVDGDDVGGRVKTSAFEVDWRRQRRIVWWWRLQNFVTVGAVDDVLRLFHRHFVVESYPTVERHFRSFVSWPILSIYWPPYLIGQAIIFLPGGFFLSSFFLFFLTYSQPSQIGYLPYYHTWCGLSANLECMSEMCCTLLAENTGRKNRHFGTIAQLCRAISSGHPCKFQQVSRLGSVTARHSISGRQPNCCVEQRAPPIFGRADITLGIGPHF